MAHRLRRTCVLLALPATVLLASCTPGAPTAPSTTSFAGSTSGATSVANPSAATSPQPSMTSVPSGSTSAKPAARPARTDASLEKALLVLDDLPSGFSVEPPGGDEEGQPVISSKNPKCRALVGIMNADGAPGSRASASTSFSGGQDGPWIDEYLDAMGSPERVSDFHDAIARAVKACPKLTLTLPEGRSTMVVRAVKAPEAGEDAVAFRITADGGDLDGFEATQVSTAIDDVELTLIFFGAYPEEIEDATFAAHGKAHDELHGKTAVAG